MPCSVGTVTVKALSTTECGAAAYASVPFLLPFFLLLHQLSLHQTLRQQLILAINQRNVIFNILADFHHIPLPYPFAPPFSNSTGGHVPQKIPLCPPLDTLRIPRIMKKYSILSAGKLRPNFKSNAKK